LSRIFEHENATHGELIRLENVQSGAEIANSIKTMEFFKCIAAEAESGVRKYNFVTKLDDDAFLVATKFYAEVLLPRLRPQPVKRTLIARLMQLTQQFVWPQGFIYTLSWDKFVLLAELLDRNPIQTEPEDVLVGRLLYDARFKLKPIL
jgi:hypothetical protein